MDDVCYAIVTKDIETGFVQVYRTYDSLDDAVARRSELDREINKHQHRCNIAIVGI